MDELDKLRQRRDATLKAAQEIVDVAKDEGRKVTPEEGAKFDALMVEYNDLDADIGRREQIKVAEDRLKKVTRQIEPEPIAKPIGTGSRIEVMPPGYDIKLRAFTGPGAHERAYRAGMWCRAMIFGDGRAKDWCREHGPEMRVMTEGVNTAGGFLVPTEMENAIIKLREEYGLARRVCKIRRMASDTEVIPRRSAGVTSYFIGENTAITPSDVSYNQVQLTAKKLATGTRISSDLTEDAVVNVAEDVAEEAGYAFAVKEDQCLIDGDGTSDYGGMVGFRTKMVDGNHAASYITATAGDDQFTELLLADIISVIGKLPQYAQANAAWYCSQYAWGAGFLRLLGAVGGNTIQALTAGAAKEFMGYPVELSPAMPSATTAYNLTPMLAFGDMSKAATLGDRRGITVKVDDSIYADYDQLYVRVTERIDIVVHDIGDASSAGPLVGLVGQT